MNKRKIRNAHFRLAMILSCIILGALAVTLVALLLLKDRPTEVPAPEPTDDERPKITEIRGVYVPTVYNISFPSKPDLSEDELKAELDEIVRVTEENSLNTIFFQVRPTCDSLYKSDIFPASAFLTSSEKAPLDCLEYLVSTAHDRGIAVHAWINPLRVSTSASDVADVDPASPAAALADSVVPYDGKLYFDAGDPAVRELICKGVREIAENYKVDGIMFDDYFYPYPVYTENDAGERVIAAFADEKTYSLYSDGKSLSDFRRSNINALIESVYNTIKETDEKISFGVAPFGIWQNDDGSNGGSLTRGAESYSDNYSDTLAWIKGGYVDYVAPQLYWDMNNSAASYKVLAKWWDLRVSEQNENSKDHKISLLISHAPYRYADTFPEGEMTSQLDYASMLTSYEGSVFYAYNAISSDEGGSASEIREYYKTKDEKSPDDTEAAGEKQRR